MPGCRTAASSPRTRACRPPRCTTTRPTCRPCRATSTTSTGRSRAAATTAPRTGIDRMHIDHQPQRERFATTIDGHEAELEYRREGDVLVITHTGVPEAI